MGVNLKISRPSVLVFWVISLMLFGYLTLSAFGVVPIGKLLGQPLGVGIILLFGAVILFTETFGEGDRPSPEELLKFENVGTSLAVVLAVLLVVAGVMTLANMAIPHWLSVLLPAAYALTFILVVKEGFE